MKTEKETKRLSSAIVVAIKVLASIAGIMIIGFVCNLNSYWSSPTNRLFPLTSVFILLGLIALVVIVPSSVISMRENKSLFLRLFLGFGLGSMCYMFWVMIWLTSLIITPPFSSSYEVNGGMVGPALLPSERILPHSGKVVLLMGPSTREVTVGPVAWFVQQGGKSIKVGQLICTLDIELESRCTVAEFYEARKVFCSDGTDLAMVSDCLALTTSELADTSHSELLDPFVSGRDWRIKVFQPHFRHCLSMMLIDKGTRLSNIKVSYIEN